MELRPFRLCTHCSENWGALVLRDCKRPLPVIGVTLCSETADVFQVER